MEPQLLSPERVRPGSWRAVLFAPVDIASLVFFRIAFGVILLWEVRRYFQHGWISRYYIDPLFHFKYYGFEWVHPLSGGLMYAFFLLLGVLAICVALGLWYRWSAFFLFLGFTYLFLLDQARYLNHFYLICLICFLMIGLPAQRAFSLDVLRRPALSARTVPAWTLWILRAQIGIVYFYGGLAKINVDWLQGEPLRHWLAKRADYPLIGPLLAGEGTVWLFSYGGLLLDLFIVPLLLWKRTRPFAFALAVGFHLTNAFVFRIGIFPWFMIAATTLYFSPDWPRRLFPWFTRRPAALSEPAEIKTSRQVRVITTALLACYLAVQLLFPLRHILYPGNVNWTEEGHRFSWRMKLRHKKTTVKFFATDPTTNVTWKIKVREYLSKRQKQKMAPRPDMLLQFAHFLKDELKKQGFEQIEIRAHVKASLNSRPLQLLVDPMVDLSKQKRTLLTAPWIKPLGGALEGDRHAIALSAPQPANADHFAESRSSFADQDRSSVD